ncbi:hypothetical protein pb186bvf_009509 [Paramecium bursaria]
MGVTWENNKYFKIITYMGESVEQMHYIANFIAFSTSGIKYLIFYVIIDRLSSFLFYEQPIKLKKQQLLIYLYLNFRLNNQTKRSDNIIFNYRFYHLWKTQYSFLRQHIRFNDMKQQKSNHLKLVYEFNYKYKFIKYAVRL